MADTQSILQLGIEAARAGNKAEARELFRLVTREDPNNAQGWLWLAGVAEDRDEKRVALERVVQIEPSNQLAQKGLAALGGPSPAASAPARDPGMTAPLPVEPRADIPRAQPAPPSGPASDQDIADAFDSIDDYAAAPESNRARTYEQPGPAGGYVPPDFGDEDYDLSEYQNRPRISADDIAARDRDTVVVVEDEEPRRRGLMAWLPLLLVLLLVCVGGLVGLNWILNDDGNQTAVNDPGAGLGGTTIAETSTADTGLGVTTPLTGTDVAVQPGGEIGASPVPGVEGSPAPVEQPPASPAPGGEASPAPVEQPPASPAPGGEASPAPVEQPPASPAPGGEASPAPVEQPPASPAPGVDVASANPAIVPNTQLLSAGGFEYSFGSGLTNVATGSYGGGPPARGQYLIVLAYVRNTGATAQQIPDGFFVVKDAQGRVSDFNRAASVDYINRFGGTGPGGAGDYPANAPLPPGAPLGSIPLLFDIATDATDVVLFSRDNPSQGFRVR